MAPILFVCVGFVSNNFVTRRWHCSSVQNSVWAWEIIVMLLTGLYCWGTTTSSVRLFPPECRLECPSDHIRHMCLPCLTVLLSSPNLSSPLLTLMPTTAESTVFCQLVRDFSFRPGALSTLLARSQPVLITRLLDASVSRDKGGRVKEAPRVANPSGFGTRRLIRDIGVFRLRYTRGLTPGRALQASDGIWSCGGFFCRGHVYGLLPCLRNRTQFLV